MSALLDDDDPEDEGDDRAAQGRGPARAVKVMVGGAPVTQAFADEIGADGYGANAGARRRCGQGAVWRCVTAEPGRLAPARACSAARASASLRGHPRRARAYRRADSAARAPGDCSPRRARLSTPTARLSHSRSLVESARKRRRRPCCSRRATTLRRAARPHAFVHRQRRHGGDGSRPSHRRTASGDRRRSARGDDRQPMRSTR